MIMQSQFSIDSEQASVMPGFRVLAYQSGLHRRYGNSPAENYGMLRKNPS